MIGRKTIKCEGEFIAEYIAEIRDFANEMSAELNFIKDATLDAATELESITQTVLERARENGDYANAAAVDYLHAVGLLSFSYMFANIATLRASFAHGAQAIVAKKASAKELPSAIKAVVKGQTFASECLREQLHEAGTGDQSQAPQLSGKEREVVRMLASGLTVSQIAARVNRSISTISKQKSTAMNRLCISTDVDLFAYARSAGMVP